MSRFNRKGYRNLVGQTKGGELKSFPVKIGSDIDAAHSKRVRKLKKDQTKAFREYKTRLKEIKKRVPLEERSKINLANIPEKYLYALSGEAKDE